MVVRNLNWVINNGFFDKLVKGSGKNVFLLDTGTVIDLEQDYFMNGYREDVKRRKYPAALLERISMSHPIIITPSVMDEIRNHAKNCMINPNRPEISEAMLVLMERLYEDESRTVLEVNQFSLMDYDRIGLQVYHASQEVFKEDYRKGEKDKISCADRELITLSLLLSKGVYGNSEIGCVNVLSSDEHIPRTLHALKNLERFKDYFVRAIPTRNDLRSYLSGGN